MNYSKDKTPFSWRVGLWTVVILLTALANTLHATIGSRGQAFLGFLAFLTLIASFSSNLRKISFKTMAWGIGLQFLLAVLVIYVEPVQNAFRTVGDGIKKLIDCSDKGADFVFGSLSRVDGPSGFVFAFKALPPIIFISAFFSLLYYLGVLQLLVRVMAKLMMWLMGTSGAETLSVSANVFMGQTEAPLIVKPFVSRMTQSELLALMASGMAHISGGMMAVYISYGADPASILCTCIMACPCSLYLTKLLLPEMGSPETMGNAEFKVEKTHVNAVDAISAGVKDGLFLALNVAAMLIGFIAFIALIDTLLGTIKPGLLKLGIAEASLNWLPSSLRLQDIFGFIFRPVAILIGVEPAYAGQVGSLLGIKLAANEHVAFLALKNGTLEAMTQPGVLLMGLEPTHMGPFGGLHGIQSTLNEHMMNLAQKNAELGSINLRSKILTVYALTGFANFASVGIQLGGIGAMAPERRPDLARLGMKALLVGFVATLVNACVAGMLMPK